MDDESSVPPLAEAHRAARAAFEKGDYESVVSLCQPYVGASVVGVSRGERRTLLALQNERARALRNMGRLQDALQGYVSALRSANQSDDAEETAWQLVQLGKAFGKYFQRHTFFSACLREAEARLSEILKASAGPPEPRTLRRFAIVQDLLGSYYRAVGAGDETARARCLESYKLSVRHHRLAKNPDGMSRAVCHLALAVAAFATHPRRSGTMTTRRLRASLLLFEFGAARTYQTPGARRGRATRRAQHASIYLELQHPAASLPLLEEAMDEACEHDDPRAMWLAYRLYGRALTELGRPEDALKPLELARSVADTRGFVSLCRQVLPDLVAVYLALEERIRVVEALEEYDRLVERELAEFAAGSGEVLDVFRLVAPVHGDLYLREGQRQDYDGLVRDLIQNGRLLRELVLRYERSRSSQLQLEVHRFTKASLQHSIKNCLKDIAVTARLLEQEPGRDTATRLKQIKASVDQIGRVVGSRPAADGPGGASFAQQLTAVAQEYFEAARLENRLSEDVVFKGLAPELLRNALRHLVENAAAAVRNCEPGGSDVPLLLITGGGRDGHLPSGDREILLMNPGLNPPNAGTPDSADASGHGWANAKAFFEQILGCDCRFELRDDGPASDGQRTNCVVLRFSKGRTWGAVWVPPGAGLRV
jgi:tetratricopeptide (TPR) repeat protein